MGDHPFLGLPTPAGPLFGVYPVQAAPLANGKLGLAKQLGDLGGGIPLLQSPLLHEQGQSRFHLSETQKHFGSVDILVNNAGIAGVNKKTWEFTPDEWRSVIEVDLNAVFYCCRAVVPLMLMRGWGRIVSIASVAGLHGIPGQTNYAAAKAGVIGMMRVLAKELARRKITANAIAPGVVETSMMGDIKEEVRAEYLKQIPLGRFAQPADVANAVLFLCSEESGYITGQVLPVTGGWLV